MPFDNNSSCFECHGDMYEPTSVFDHPSHVRQLEGNASCGKCHDGVDAAKTYETAAACAECHKDLEAPSSVIEGEPVRLPSTMRSAVPQVLSPRRCAR